MIKVAKIINQKRYAQAVQAYIEYWFETYGISYKLFFGLDEDDSYEGMPCYDSEWNLNEDMISYAATILGISQEDILSCNQEAAEKWMHKYSFFEQDLDTLFANPMYSTMPIELIRGRSRKKDETAEEHLLRLIFEGSKPAFDKESIKNRLRDFLEQANEYAPGINRKNQKMVKLNVNTAVMQHYPNFKEVLESYIEVVSNFRELFAKALDRDLNDEEIKEFNFLSSALYAYDVHATSRKSFLYDDFKELREIYIKDGFQDFFDIGRFRNQVKPWRFVEFVKDKELAQRYFDLFPSWKPDLIEFSNDVAFFCCTFWWEDDLQKFLGAYGGDPKATFRDSLLSEDDAPLEYAPISVKIPKTADELFGEEKSIKVLREMGRSEKMGGLRYRERWNNPFRDPFEKRRARMGVLRDRNYFDNYIKTLKPEVE